MGEITELLKYIWSSKYKGNPSVSNMQNSNFQLKRVTFAQFLVFMLTGNILEFMYACVCQTQQNSWQGAAAISS